LTNQTNQIIHNTIIINMKKIFYLVIIGMIILSVRISKAQEANVDKTKEEPSKIEVSGSVDAYFRSNINGTNDPESGTIAPSSSFANLPGFALGMINIVGTYEKGNVGAVADLVYGPRGADAVFGSPASLNIVNQLYVYWNVSDAVTLTLGNFNTFLGYEVISPLDNFNYSTSYLFSYGPFSHTGLKADFNFGEGFSGMIAVMNPTDATDFNPTNDYVGGLQLGYANNSGSIYLNSIISDGFFQFDLTAGLNFTDSFYGGINFSSASNDNFLGGALYFQVATGKQFSLGLRGEYFQDQGINVLGFDPTETNNNFARSIANDENIIALTLSGNYKVGNLTLIPEIRIDSFSVDDVVIMNSNDADLSNNLSSFLLAGVFSF